MNKLRPVIKRRSSLSLELSAVGDGALLGRFAGLGSIRFDGLDDVHSFDDASEDNVFSVEPLGLDRAEEELRSVGVGASVSLKTETDIMTSPSPPETVIPDLP